MPRYVVDNSSYGEAEIVPTLAEAYELYGASQEDAVIIYELGAEVPVPRVRDGYVAVYISERDGQPAAVYADSETDAYRDAEGLAQLGSVWVIDLNDLR